LKTKIIIYLKYQIEVLYNIIFEYQTM